MQRVLDAAEKHGWDARRRGRFRVWFTRGDYSIDFVYDLTRHSKGRAYRNNALSAILAGQRDVVNYMEVQREG